MFKIDVVKLRKEKQVINYDRISSILKDGNLSVLKRECNTKELCRVLSYLDLTEVELIKMTKNNSVIRKLCAMKIAKMATRQGISLESVILSGISNSLSRHKISIRSLGVNEIRPLRNGGIISGKELRTKKMSKNFDTLKSIDGSISGRIEGYIFAKVLTGDSGGHQDNVVREARDFMEWALKEDEKKFYIALIDGDHTHKGLQELMKYESNNVWICDHIEFQNRIVKILND